CPSKRFQDVLAPCGTDAPSGNCSCPQHTGGMQNSYQDLMRIAGPPDGEPPTIMIDAPEDGATVTPGFKVQTTAMDNVTVSKVYTGSRCIGDLGTVCKVGSDCVSATCVTTDTGRVCSQFCNAGGSCPSGFDCVKPTLGLERCEKAAAGGGGCETSGGAAHDRT